MAEAAQVVSTQFFLLPYIVPSFHLLIGAVRSKRTEPNFGGTFWEYTDPHEVAYKNN